MKHVEVEMSGEAGVALKERSRDFSWADADAGSENSLRTSGKEYIRFFMDNPELLDTPRTSEFLSPQNSGDREKTGYYFENLFPKEIGKGDLKSKCLILGLSSLLVNRVLTGDSDYIDRLIDDVLEGVEA